MIITEQVADKLQRLPMVAQEEVLDFVEFLLEKSARRNKTEKLGGEQKAETIKRWAKSHSLETPVILDDRREIIYED